MPRNKPLVPKTESDKLTEKHIRFSQEYIIDLNGSKAAIRAGYSEISAYSTSSELLSYPKIQVYIQELLEERANRTQVTADKVISELYHLLTFDVSEIFDDNGKFKDIHVIPKELRKAIASIEVYEEYSGKGKNRQLTGYTKKIKFWDKIKVIELLAKHLGLIADKGEQSGDHNNTYVFANITNTIAGRPVGEVLAELNARLSAQFIRK